MDLRQFGFSINLLICFWSKKASAFSGASAARRGNSFGTSLPSTQDDVRTTLPQYLQEMEVEAELSAIMCSAACACSAISDELGRLPIYNFYEADEAAGKGGRRNVQGEVQKGMDVVANEIFVEAVKDSVAALASEEEDEVICGDARSGRYEIAFDPLDGSSNLDVSAPTGTIFGIAPLKPGSPFSSSGRSLLAAGYAVYSSSVELVVSLGPSGSLGAAGFTLDPAPAGARDFAYGAADRFVLTRPRMRCPARGPYYSLNDGREPDWPDGLRRWIRDAKRGETPSGTVFSSRYVCSLCADVHRTLIKGGWAGNPRPHLRLLYEAAPLAHVAEACGGRGSDGVVNLLDIVPTGLHDRTSVFIGSMDDVCELEEYGDVQQAAKAYNN